MLIRISPQWQVTIPKALRPHFGPARQVEARMENMALVLRPVLASTASDGAALFAAEGITTEVLMAAMAVVERRRRTAALRQADPAP
jgi:hypothetical protein